VFTALLNNLMYSTVRPIANDSRIPLSGLPLLNNNTQPKTDHNCMPQCKLIGQHKHKTHSALQRW